MMVMAGFVFLRFRDSRTVSLTKHELRPEMSWQGMQQLFVTVQIPAGTPKYSAKLPACPSPMERRARMFVPGEIFRDHKKTDSPDSLCP
jgi:hypothetical protein